MIEDRCQSLLIRVVLVSYALLISSSVCRAQSSTAALSGTAIDESRAAVPRVDITLTNHDTGLERRVTTNGEGLFSIPSLPPGRYELSALREGFSKIEVRDLLLNVADQRAIVLLLKVGTQSDSVLVVGCRTPTDTQTGAVTNGYTSATVPW